MSAESIANVLDADIEQWYEAQRNEGTVNRNVMAVGLIMCEHMSTHFPLNEAQWFTGSQVSLLGGTRIKNILAQNGEDRPFASEGGRTSRGSQDLARSFQEAVNRSSAAGEFEELLEDDKLSVIDLLQARMVGRIRADFYDRQRLPLEIDFNKQTRHTVDRLLAAARDKGGNTIGAVAQHLVGATLEIRHTDLAIENQSYTTADQQTGRVGDFMVNDTAIHVTVAPTEALVAMCPIRLFVRGLEDGPRWRGGFWREARREVWMSSGPLGWICGHGRFFAPGSLCGLLFGPGDLRRCRGVASHQALQAPGIWLRNSEPTGRLPMRASPRLIGGSSPT